MEKTKIVPKEPKCWQLVYDELLDTAVRQGEFKHRLDAAACANVLNVFNSGSGVWRVCASWEVAAAG